MARDIIDDRLIGALHLRALTRNGLDHDPAAEHTAVQAGTIDALLAGQYAGDATIGEVLRLGDLGVGTVQELDGELMILDGEAWLAPANGTLRRVHDSEKTPFAVVTAFSIDRQEEAEALDYTGIQGRLDDLAGSSPVIAVRVRGEFTDVQLRSVHKQSPPYPPLAEVVKHQTEWSVPAAAGTLLGFRFPDATSGVEVPGYHLHFLSDDRTVGGHVLSVSLKRGTLAVKECDDLHVELPPGVTLGTPGATDRDTIAAVESAPATGAGDP